jgi:hypothetical protein
MELRYENLKNKPKVFRAFTGLDVAEFQILLQAFIVAWERYVQQHRLPSDVHQRDYGGGRKARLATCKADYGEPGRALCGVTGDAPFAKGG